MFGHADNTDDGHDDDGDHWHGSQALRTSGSPPSCRVGETNTHHGDRNVTIAAMATMALMAIDGHDDDGDTLDDRRPKVEGRVVADRARTAPGYNAARGEGDPRPLL